MAWSDRQSSQPPKRQVSLRVRKGPLRGQFFPTSDAHALLIGSAASNHIVLPHEQVSATHCLLARRRSGKSFALIDARSRHGTEVNGRRLAKGTVTLGDVIAIGPFELELVETLSAQRPPYAVRPSAGRPARIELLSPGDEVEVLRPASATILGRGRLAHVAVDDSFVSTFHCLITLHPDDDDRQPFVIDLYSENGTFVNGRSVHRKHMRLSDTLAVGQAEFILRLHEAGWQAAEPEPEAAPLEGAPRPASRIVLAARPSRPAAREPVVLPMLEAPAAKARAAEAADAGPTLAASTPPPPVPPAGVVTEPAAAPPDRTPRPAPRIVLPPEPPRPVPREPVAAEPRELIALEIIPEEDDAAVAADAAPVFSADTPAQPPASAAADWPLEAHAVPAPPQALEEVEPVLALPPEAAAPEVAQRAELAADEWDDVLELELAEPPPGSRPERVAVPEIEPQAPVEGEHREPAAPEALPVLQWGDGAEPVAPPQPADGGWAWAPSAEPPELPQEAACEWNSPPEQSALSAPETVCRDGDVDVAAPPEPAPPAWDEAPTTVRAEPAQPAAWAPVPFEAEEAREPQAADAVPAPLWDVTAEVGMPPEPPAVAWEQAVAPPELPDVAREWAPSAPFPSDLPALEYDEPIEADTCDALAAGPPDEVADAAAPAELPLLHCEDAIERVPVEVPEDGFPESFALRGTPPAVEAEAAGPEGIHEFTDPRWDEVGEAEMPAAPPAEAAPVLHGLDPEEAPEPLLPPGPVEATVLPWDDAVQALPEPRFEHAPEAPPLREPVGLDAAPELPWDEPALPSVPMDSMVGGWDDLDDPEWAQPLDGEPLDALAPAGPVAAAQEDAAERETFATPPVPRWGQSPWHVPPVPLPVTPLAWAFEPEPLGPVPAMSPWQAVDDAPCPDLSAAYGDAVPEAARPEAWTMPPVEDDRPARLMVAIAEALDEIGSLAVAAGLDELASTLGELRRTHLPSGHCDHSWRTVPPTA